MRVAEPSGDFPQFAVATRNRFLRRKAEKRQESDTVGRKWDRWNRQRIAPQCPHFGPRLNYLLPNASTCNPSRRRTMVNRSTVSKASEIEVAAAAPWPPKRGTSAMQSATFMTKASA